MKPLLHDANEELDLQVYRAYIRSLTNDELRDIQLHLDVDQFPARCDVLRHELEKRGLIRATIIRSLH